jgi:hypothetical protein
MRVLAGVQQPPVMGAHERLILRTHLRLEPRYRRLVRPSARASWLARFAPLRPTPGIERWIDDAPIAASNVGTRRASPEDLRSCP